MKKNSWYAFENEGLKSRIRLHFDIKKKSPAARQKISAFYRFFKGIPCEIWGNYKR